MKTIQLLFLVSLFTGAALAAPDYGKLSCEVIQTGGHLQQRETYEVAQRGGAFYLNRRINLPGLYPTLQVSWDRYGTSTLIFEDGRNFASAYSNAKYGEAFGVVVDYPSFAPDLTRLEVRCVATYPPVA